MLTIVGAGPGAEDLLTLRAIRKLQEADIVITPSRLLNIVKKFAHNSEIVLLNPKNVRQQILEIYGTYRNKNIVIVSSGDPLFSGIGKTVIDLGLECEIVPGISSIQAACAKVRTSWDNMIVLTLHEREHIENRLKIIEKAISLNNKIGILTAPDYPPSYVLSLLTTITKKLNKKYRVYICENLTMSNEKIVKLEIPESSTTHIELGWNSVIIIEPSINRHSLLYNPVNL